MKVCLVTLIDNNNYGTLLQAYASATIIQRMGNEVFFLNYYRNIYSPCNLLRLRFQSNQHFIKKMLDIPVVLIVMPIKHKYLIKFLNKNFAFTKRYNSIDQIKDIDADLFVAGSDQIWNTEWNHGIDKVFYLDFVGKESKKISFASSIGLSQFDEKYKSQLKSLFSNFLSITIRERLSLSLFEDLNIPDVKAVLDPTLLITKKEWQELLNIQKIDEKYILVYCVEYDKSRIVIELAKKIAKKRNLSVYVIENGNPFRYSSIGIKKRYFSPSVPKMVQLFYNADCTIVSSFHGLAFSINFGKPFIVVKPEKYNVRIDSLVQDFELQENEVEIKNLKELTEINDISSIDYKKINNILDFKRKESLEILNNNFRRCK